MQIVKRPVGQCFSFPTSRGAFLLIGSQGIAIFVGFIIHVGLTRLLLPEFYGLYAVAISVLMWGELLITGSIGIAFAKVLSEGTTSAKEVWQWVWQGYLPLWLGLWLAFSAGSWGIASWLRDERLVLLLLVAGLELPFFGVYIAEQSLLQGLMAYGWQAVVSALWALLRLIAVFAFAVATRSVLGAIAGNTLAVVAVAFLSVIFVRPFLRETDAPGKISFWSLLVGIGLPVLLITLLDQITLTMDLWLLKRMAEPEFAGFYGAARFFALALLVLAGGLGSAWFPAMCHELGKQERDRAKALLKEAMRVLILGLLPFAVIVWATAKPLSVFLFSPSFEPTSEPMRWLVIAISLFTFMAFMRAALIADNEFRLPIIFAVLMAVTDYTLCCLLIPHYGMIGAAWTTTLTSAANMVVMWVFTTLRFGNFVSIGTLVRVSVASFFLWLVVFFWSASGLMLLTQYILLTAFYVLLLAIFGEIKASDWQVLKVVFTSIMADAVAVFSKAKGIKFKNDRQG